MICGGWKKKKTWQLCTGVGFVFLKKVWGIPLRTSSLMKARTIGDNFSLILTHPDFFVNAFVGVCSLRLQSVMQVSNTL